MKLIIRKKIILILLIFSSLSGMAQNDSVDIGEFFNDDNISNSKCLVKLNAGALFQNEYSISFDYMLFRGVSLELGGGYLSDKYSSIGFLIEESITTEYPGFVVSAEIKTHSSLEFRGRCSSFGIENRVFKEFRTTNIYCSMGWQIRVFERLLIEPSFLMGFTFYRAKTESANPNEKVDAMNVSFPLMLKIGYLL